MIKHFRSEQSFSDSSLEEAAYKTYKELFRQIADAQLQPLRIWNFVTNINYGANENGAGDNERYKLFNRGRRQAWLEYDKSLKTICAATCVGSFGPDILKVVALATSNPVIHLENPDQISFLDYSAKYGTPPSSRRGTLHFTPSGVEIYISGTASITGEDNRFAGDHEPKDFAKQTEQTLKNIQTLISDENLTQHYSAWQSQCLSLSALRHVKIYLRNMSDQNTAQAILEAANINPESTEFIHADICRRPLDIEIEGMIPAIPDTK